MADSAPTTIHDILEEYARLAPDTRTKGFLFERLMRTFLTTDPTWSSKFDGVWLWQDWPDRAGKVDTGIDLVARDRFTGELCAIQCKFYSASHTVQKSDIDSFFTASGKAGFSSRIIVTTTDKWSKHALDALEDQQIPTSKLGVNDLVDSEIDWSTFHITTPDVMRHLGRKTVRPYQREAIDDVKRGFEANERGKLIMACGTGKTFTSLRLTEELVGPGGSVLFLVPSIALLSQTLREWTAQAAHPIRAFAICSDTKVGKSSEDYTVSDLAFPATTDTGRLVQAASKASNPDGLTVYFSTYQSIDVVAKAQAQGLPEFDLVVCDEAHRTTGVKLQGKQDFSAFARVHDGEYIRGKHRLYMTATPKIYGEAVKSKAADAFAEIISMDDEQRFGPEFHRLGFGAAVERGLLTDYRVLVLAIDEEAISRDFQNEFASWNGELNISDAARLVGIYNGLAKRGVAGVGEEAAEFKPLKRAVSFSSSIAASKAVSDQLDGYTGPSRAALSEPAFATAELTEADVEAHYEAEERRLRLESRHVDGTMNVLTRTNLLEWLKDDADEDVCRILTNARCLSEGVDVPALDAVIFLNSRDSQVDVVQSVGRVMRLSEGKEFGYIVLPVAVAAGVKPEQALNDNAKFKVVWDVLRALRAHDERFEAMVQKLDLGVRDTKIQAIGFGEFGAGENARSAQGETDAPGDTETVIVDAPQALDFSALGEEWRTAIYAKLVEKVGSRQYWDNWAKNVAEIAARQQLRVRDLVQGADARLADDFTAFVKALQDNLNPSVTDEQAIEMLAQHLVTLPLFEALFENHSFKSSNPISESMQFMVELLEEHRLDTELDELGPFYENVKRSIEGITDPLARQTTIKRLYEKFFKVAFPQLSERHGMVYTPNEVVDFILRSADDVLRREFGKSLSDRGVHVLDPFTGTGTFITNLLLSGLIRDEDLPHKYRHNLHANEIMLLAYYIAAVNIEETYAGLTGERLAFPGIVLTDTFQMGEEDDQLDGSGVFPENNRRVVEQSGLDISVIVGNPPYSAGQDSANDNNANLSYETLDGKIRDSYAAKSTSQNKNSLYDSYIRAIKWASDRIGDRGVVAFVTNGGFLDGNTADGLRKSLVDEFSSLYIFNLRGNQRSAGEQSRREGGKIFGAGSRASVAISILVKNPDASQRGVLNYHDIGDYLTREQKLATISELGGVDGTAWERIEPNQAGDWASQRDTAFSGFTPLNDRAQVSQGQIFRERTAGIKTNRDPWVYSFSKSTVSENVERLADTYNGLLSHGRLTPSRAELDATTIGWSGGLASRLRRNSVLNISAEALRPIAYRPFNRQWAYISPDLNERQYRVPLAFPTSNSSNRGIVITSSSSHSEFAAIATDLVPDLHTLDTGQFFPRYTYVAKSSAGQLDVFGDDDGDPYERVDNITDEILVAYRRLYGADVTKDDIFYFVYGILHSPEYRERYAADLKKMLPRIPDLAEASDFWSFAIAGRALSDLHLGYESVEKWAGLVVSTGSTAGTPDLRVTKMRYGGKAGAWDKTVVRYNDDITISGIPLESQEYKLGSRSALDWILERYQVKTDKASGIVNDPNDWGLEHGDPEYILNLVQRIVTVSMRTVEIVNGLPPLRIRENSTDEA